MNEFIIIITGSSKGIGRFLAEYYSSKNYKVIGFSRSKADIRSDNYEHISVDVTDEKEIRKAFALIRKKYGRLDAVINCAGINPISHFLLIPAEFAERAFKINVIGLMNVCRESIKLMTKGKSGRIINFGSMAVRHKVIGDSVYASTKAAINAFTEILAKEVNAFGITCNVIAPSAIPTDMSEKIDQEILTSVLSRNAIPSYGVMEDVSNVTDWLLQKESASITGQIIYLGGA